MEKIIITWRNKMSNETGYVADIKMADGHIVSADEQQKPKVYTRKYANTLLKKMKQLGMEQQNEYDMIPV